jgi:hypothetical protein
MLQWCSTLPRMFRCMCFIFYDHIGKFKMIMFYTHFQLQLDGRSSVKLLTYDLKVMAATRPYDG